MAALMGPEHRSQAGPGRISSCSHALVAVGSVRWDESPSRAPPPPPPPAERKRPVKAAVNAVHPELHGQLASVIYPNPTF